MSKGFAVKTDGSYAGWYGDEQTFENKRPRLEAGAVFVKDDTRNPDVAALTASRDRPTRPPQSNFNDDVILSITGTPSEQAAAKVRLKARME